MSNGSLDDLAANGIINFDANAYIKGTPPRYVGRPEREYGLPLEQPVFDAPTLQEISHNIHLNSEPAKDAFISHTKKNNKLEITWPQVLTIGSIAALAIYSRNKIKSWLGGSKNKITQNFKFMEQIKDYVNKVKAKITPEATKTEKVVKKSKNFISKLPKWAKITGGITAGLLALFGIFKSLSHKEILNPEVHNAE
jgi:hypothetical protein